MIKKTLTIPNPAYHKVARITGSRFAAQAEFKYYRINKQTGDTEVPRGMRGRLLNWLKRADKAFEIEDEYIDSSFKKPFVLAPNKELRGHQEMLVSDAIKEREGVVVAGTGTGKTLIGLELIRRLGLTSLILVPNTVLLDHFVNEAQEYYGLKLSQIGGGKKETSGDVIVSTWQSLGSDEGLIEKLKEKVSVIVVDECAGIVSKERMKILGQFRPKHLFGLTATPFRSAQDGRTKAIHFMLGNTLGEFSPTLITPTVDVVRTECAYQLTGTYAEMIDEMVRDDNRNTLIRGLACGEAYSGHKVMVLTKRVEHYQILREKLPDDPGFIFIDSEDKSRNEKLRLMKEGELPFSIIFGTISLLGTGTDIPQIDTMIMCADVRSDVLTVQLAGRALRWFKGKTGAKIVDLFDNKSPILKNQFYDRLRVYQSKQWIIQGLNFN